MYIPIIYIYIPIIYIYIARTEIILRFQLKYKTHMVRRNRGDLYDSRPSHTNIIRLRRIIIIIITTCRARQVVSFGPKRRLYSIIVALSMKIRKYLPILAHSARPLLLFPFRRLYTYVRNKYKLRASVYTI